MLWMVRVHLFCFFPTSSFLPSRQGVWAAAFLILQGLCHRRFSINKGVLPFWGWWCPPWCPDRRIWRMCWPPRSWWCCTWCPRWCRGRRRWLWSSPLASLPGPIQGRRAGSFLWGNVHLHPKGVEMRETIQTETGRLQIIVQMRYWTRRHSVHYSLMRRYH